MLLNIINAVSLAIMIGTIQTNATSKDNTKEYRSIDGSIADNHHPTKACNVLIQDLDQPEEEYETTSNEHVYRLDGDDFD